MKGLEIRNYDNVLNANHKKKFFLNGSKTNNNLKRKVKYFVFVKK